MSAEMLELTAAQAVAAIAAGELDRGDYFEAYRARAAADQLNALTWVAESAAEPVEGPLNGVPVAIKDLFCTEGVPSQAGSKLLAGYLPPYTATAVEKLAVAGAPLLAKTNQDEFAMGSSNENSAFGPTLNPWDRSRVPGGSSGGSAAAVAAGLAPWALGTDTGGSVRQPAAFCGIVGLKPTYGSVSRYGMIAFASSLDQAGPLTRDVTDAALLLKHMTGRDPRDATSVGHPGEIALPTGESLRGLTLGVPDGLDGEGVEPGVYAAFEAALETAKGLGASIERIPLPHADYGISAYYVLAPAEASSNLSRFDGVRYGHRGEASDLMGMYTRTRHDGFGPEVRRRVMLGTYALSSGFYDAYYASAQKVRTLIVQDYAKAFANVDLVVTPTAPGVAFGLGQFADDPLAMYLNDYFTVPLSLAGLPAISLPCGLSEGLPVGLQLAAPAFEENKLLEAAHALERAFAFDGSAARA